MPSVLLTRAVAVAFAAALLQLRAVDAYTLVSTGTTVRLNGVPYYVPPDAVGRLPSNITRIPGDFGLLPITVVSTNSSSFGNGDFQTLRTSFSETDDVFQDGFLQGSHPAPRAKWTRTKMPQCH